jgi:hypothetical protein
MEQIGEMNGNPLFKAEGGFRGRIDFSGKKDLCEVHELVGAVANLLEKMKLLGIKECVVRLEDYDSGSSILEKGVVEITEILKQVA